MRAANGENALQAHARFNNACYIASRWSAHAMEVSEQQAVHGCTKGRDRSCACAGNSERELGVNVIH